MNIVIISGSSRKASQSARISKIVKTIWDSKHPEDIVDIIDLSEYQIPFWDEAIWEDNWSYQPKWLAISSLLKAVDACIFVVPEWAGMAPAQVKNFLLLADLDLAHKPSLIASISSGMGGSYPVAELRMSGYKNTHLLWIPDHVIIRKCQDFQPAANGYEFETNRLDYCLTLLQAYAARLQGLSHDLQTQGLPEHRYGM